MKLNIQKRSTQSWRGEDTTTGVLFQTENRMAVIKKGTGICRNQVKKCYKKHVT